MSLLDAFATMILCPSDIIPLFLPTAIAVSRLSPGVREERKKVKKGEGK